MQKFLRAVRRARMESGGVIESDDQVQRYVDNMEPFSRISLIPLPAKFPPQVTSQGNGEIRNLPDRPAPWDQPIAEALSPTLGGYGLGQAVGGVGQSIMNREMPRTDDLAGVVMAIAPMPGQRFRAPQKSRSHRVAENNNKTSTLDGRNNQENLLKSGPSARLIAPPDETPRAFSDDYGSQQGQTIADANGRLIVDVDGRPIHPDAVVAGRRLLEQPDVAIQQAEMESGAAGLTRGLLEGVETIDQRGEEIGAFRPRPETGGTIQDISYRLGLPPDKTRRVIEHEVGHAIDYNAGKSDNTKLGQSIPQTGVDEYLRANYNLLNSPDPNAAKQPPRRWMGPKEFGYAKNEVAPELNAEALRAYLANPNYIKSKFPKLAQHLRDAVNTNPDVARWFHLNSLAAPIAGVTIATQSEKEPPQSDYADGGLINRALRRAKSILS